MLKALFVLFSIHTIFPFVDIVEICLCDIRIDIGVDFMFFIFVGFFSLFKILMKYL